MTNPLVKQRKISKKSVITMLTLGYVIVNLFAIVLTGFFLIEAKDQQKERAIAMAKSYVELVVNRLDNSVDKYDMLLNFMANQVAATENIGGLETAMNNQNDLFPNDMESGIINKDGDLLVGLHGVLKINYQKADFFKSTLLDSHRHETLFSPQFNGDKSVLVFSRLVENHKKENLVVFITVPVLDILDVFKKVNVGEHGLIALRDHKHGFIARVPAIQKSAQAPPASNKLAELSKINDEGDYETKTPIDGLTRVFYFKKLSYQPLYVVVGLSDKEYLSNWYDSLYQYGLFYLFFAVIFGIFSKAVYVFWQKNYYKESKLATILDSSNDGIISIDDGGKIISLNSRALTLLGYDSEKELQDVCIGTLFEDKTQINCEQFNTKIGKIDREIVLVRKDGSTFQAEFLVHPQIYETSTGKNNYIITFTDISDKKDMHKLVWKQANFDALTGLKNRVSFESELSSAIKEASELHQELAVLFIDLDHFKDVNDSIGHHAGDELLKQVANRLTDCVRATDVVARLGGDEFVIVLRNIKDTSNIDKIAQKIISEMQTPFNVHNTACNIGSSIGITRYPVDAIDLEALLQNADKAMYAAKGGGRNQFSYFSKDLDLLIKQRLKIAQDLKQAIAKEEFQLYIQPIVDTISGNITKAEILLRWFKEDGTAIGPDQFIPIAERNGLIHQIGDFVIRKSIDWLEQYYNQNPNSDFCLSVNVSPLQFGFANFIPNLEACLKDKEGNNRIPAGKLILEITEGILIEDKVNNAVKFNKVKDLGIKIAIDDFGTGYSAMAYLYKYEVDFIKIDRSFIKGSHELKNQKITKSLIAMAQNLGIEVIAEGVETQAQVELLTAMNCNYCQGYYYAKPMPIVNINQLLSSKSL